MSNGAPSSSLGAMFAWLMGLEQCVCHRERGSLWEHDMEVNESFPAVPGFKDTIPGEPGSGGLRGKLPAGPRLRAVPTFQAAETEAMIGEPQMIGTLMQVKLEESVQQMTVTLYANGFTMQPPGGGEASKISRAWSPFSLVEKCQVKTLQHSAYWAVFKLTVFRAGVHDLCLYFACTGGNAYKERDRWVEKIGSLVGHVTQSLYPLSSIQVQPLPGNEATSTRILAGFLLHGAAMDTCELVYVELHAYARGESKLTLYRDEWCDRELATLILSEATTVSTRSGVHCNVFGIDHHRFCARNGDEKDLWLRAVSNVKVKLMFEAPDPTAEEIWIFRHAVQERVALLHDGKAQGGKALLLEVTNRPPASPTGDAMDPEPIEEAEVSQEKEAKIMTGGSGDVAAGPEAQRPSQSSRQDPLRPEQSEHTDSQEIPCDAGDGEIMPGEGNVAARLPRVRAAGRLREDAAYEAILHNAPVAREAPKELDEPEVAAESGASFAENLARRQPLARQTAYEGHELSEKALECIAHCTGAQPASSEPRGIAI
ncbi:unnamed protein product [Effrenium voratum]|uniref:PH domain-containing protein n=1 Tax=Effrenium voratum TaxID=2562239 RepID=A0AA36IL29_9DINO|nr:unnamed protein product [Effrenium voratum]CAJ1427028.1 unnamed protein product [Effrenium voratum]